MGGGEGGKGFLLILQGSSSVEIPMLYGSHTPTAYRFGCARGSVGGWENKG